MIRPEHVSLILIVIGALWICKIWVDTDKRKRLQCTYWNTAYFKLSHGQELSQRNRSKLGDIYIQRDGMRYEVVLTTPSQLKQYYSHHPRDHRKLDSFGAGEYLVALLGKCLGFQNGSLWVSMRNTFNGFFTHTQAVKTLPRMINYISDWAKTYTGRTCFAVDAYEFVSDIPFTCIAYYLYGDEKCSSRLDELKRLVPLHSRILSYAFTTFFGRFKIFQSFPSSKMRELHHFKERFTALSLEMVQDQICPTSVAGELFLKVEDGTLLFDNWIETLDEILFANIDVTATIMAWSLVEIAQNETVQLKLKAEIQSCSNVRESYVKKTDTLLHRVLTETLRLHPLLWFSFPEISPHDMIIDGYKIPANTPIVIDQYQLNYNSPIWNPPHEASDFGHKFRPDRFLGLGNRESMLSNVTFGSGPRRCLGKNFAEIVIKSLLVEVLSQFCITLNDGVKLAENTFVVQPVAKLVLSKATVAPKI